MRILMIVPQPFFSPRGTPFSVYYRARALAALGHEIDIATYPLGQDVKIRGVRVHRSTRVPFIQRVKIGPSPAKLVLDVFLFFKVLWMLLTRDYDVIHAHEEGIFFCLFYRLFLWKAKIVYDMHSSLPQQLKNFGFADNRVAVGLFTFLETLAIRISSVVITICPELQRQVEAMNAGTPSVMIENTLFDEIEYRDAGDEIPDSLINIERFAGKPIVLYTGTFEPYQGIPLLLESAREVLRERPDALFILIGGHPRQIVAMRELAQRLAVKDKVIFAGMLHPNTVKRFVKRADVLVSPRIRGTNSPLKIYEYISSGKPIVATNLGTHTQILSEKEAVLTDCDPVSFARGVLSVLSVPARGVELGNQARALYETSYGGAVYADRLKKVLLHVA